MPIVVMLGGVVAVLAALIALIAGAGWGTALTIYFGAGFGLPALAVSISLSAEALRSRPFVAGALPAMDA